jgi:MFS family permease
MELNHRQKSMLHRFYAYGFLKNLKVFEPFILLFFTQAKGLSFTQFGLLIGIREVSVALLEIPTGIVADVTGRRRAMMLCFASYILSFLIFTFSSSFWLFALGMLLFGLGETFRSGTHKSMIMEHLDIEGLQDQKVHYYGMTRSASRAGSMMVALLAAGVYYFFGLQWVFLATVVPYLPALILMTTYPGELDGEVTRENVGRGLLRHTYDSFRSILKTPQLGKVLINQASFEAFFKVGKDYLQYVLVMLGIGLPMLALADESMDLASGGKIALIFAVVYFIIHLNEFISSRKSGAFVDKVQNLGLALDRLYWGFALAFVLSGTCLVAAGLLGEPWRTVFLMVTIVLVFTFWTFNNLRKPVVVGYLSDRTEKQQRATVLSVASQLRALVAFVIAPALGFVADHGPRMSAEQAFSPFVFVGGGAALVALGILLRLGRQTGKDAPETEEVAE